MTSRRRLGALDPVLASLATLSARINKLVAAIEDRDRELAATRASLATLWRRLEVVEKRAALRALPSRPAVEATSAPPPAQELRPAPALERRIPIARAAVILGTSRKHALRLAAEGLLDAADLRREGAPRAAWSVTADSLERLLAARAGRPGPLDHENGASAGRAPVGTRKGG